MTTQEETLGMRLRVAFDFLNAANGGGRKYNPNWLALQIDISRASIYKWMNNPGAGIDGENLAKAARALQVNPDWLATGYGAPKTVSPSGGTYVCADSLEDAIRQIRAKGPDDVLRALRALAAP